MMKMILSYYYITNEVFWVKCSKILKMVKQEVEELQISNVLAREAEHTFPLRSQNMK